MRNVVLLFLINFVVISAFAQPGDNPNQAWKEAQYTRFSVVHDSGISDKADRIGQILHSIQYHGTQTLGHSYDDIPILIQHYNPNFNGFVSIAPFQSEFYGVAPPNNSILGSTDWLDVLTIHEYRHVIQFSQAKRSPAVKVASILFGGFGWATATGLVLPNWFIEGDATWFETATTQNGRGRLALFHNLNSTIALEGKPLPFNTALNRSYLRPNPTRYQLGYLMSKYVFEEYGLQWHNILKDATAYEGILFPFRKAVKKYTGKKLKTIYQEAMMAYQNRIAKMDYRMPATYQIPLHKTKRHGRTNFHAPIRYQGHLYAIQEGWEHEPRLVRFKNNKPEKVFNLGLNTNYTFDIKNDWVVWSEKVPHIRRANMGYHHIFLRNIKTDETHTIAHPTQYFSPTFNADASKIVATEQDSMLHFYLVELNTTGTILSRTEGPNAGQFLFPWYKNDSTIIVMEKARGAQRIYEYKPSSQNWKLLLGPTFISMHHGRLQDSIYYFSAAFHDKDELFALHLDSLTTHKIATSKVGLYYPFVDSTGVYAADFTRTGYNLVQLDSTHLRQDTLEVVPVQIDSQSVFHSSSFRYARQVLDSLNPIEPHRHDTYNRFRHGMNVYAWSPYTTFTESGIQVFSENLLGNTFLSANYSYDFELNQNAFEFQAQYAAFYPIFDAAFRLNSDADFDYVRSSGDTAVFVMQGNLPRTEQSIRMRLPFNLAKNNQINHNLNLFTTIGFQQFSQLEQSFNQATLGVQASWQLTSPQRFRMLNPRYGLALNATYNQSISNENTYTYAGAFTLLPGLLRSHSFTVGVEYYTQQFDAEEPFRYRRFHGGDYLVGITDGFNETNFLATYRMPLFYPNFGVGQFLFFPRIRTNLFASYTNIDYELVQREVYTLAGDLIIETNFMDNFNFNLGFRYGVYKIDQQDWEPEFNFFVNIPLLNGILLKPQSVFTTF